MNIGLSLYSVRNELNSDFKGTMEKIARIGYTHMEFAAHSMSAELLAQFPPKAIRQYLKDTGMTPMSNHIGMAPDTDWDQVVAFNAELGVQAVVLPFAFMNNRDEIARLAQTCNMAGQKCKDAGMRFFYHNHFQEYALVDGRPAMDIFMEETDPGLVSLELDTFWVLRGGHDPVVELGKLGKRCGLVHQKDLSATASPVNLYEVISGELNMEAVMGLMQSTVKNTDFVEIGTGVMDIRAICRKAKEIDAACIIVEQDQINMPVMDSLTISFNNLKALLAE